MGERRERTPWEQHASASGLPRFNYKPLSSSDSLKGFLITCAFDREKSATKEAMSILTKYLGSPSMHNVTESDLPSDEKQGEKNEENRNEALEIIAGEKASKSTTGGLSTTHMHSSQTNEGRKDAGNLKRSRANFENVISDDENGVFFVKMAQKGIISIFWGSSNSENPVTLLSKVFADIENGSTASPRWCQRMVPVQESSVYTRNNLSAMVVKLVKEYLQEPLPTEMQPLKYAISFNRRGFETRDVDGSKNLQDGEGFDRMSCIHVVTAAILTAAPHAVVDLKAPQMVVLVEVLPLAGAHSSPVCGVAALSGALMTTKPKLSVKALVPGSHRAKR